MMVRHSSAPKGRERAEEGRKGETGLKLKGGKYQVIIRYPFYPIIGALNNQNPLQYMAAR